MEGRSEELVAAINASADHGLPLSRYHLAALRRPVQAKTVAARAEADLLLSDAFLQQIRHRAVGVVSPHSLDPDWDIAPRTIDVVSVYKDALRRPDPVGALDELWPNSDEYRQLVAHRKQLAAQPETTSHDISAGAILRIGAEGPRVVELKQRLYGPGSYDAVFDDRLQKTLAAFQRAAGLEADGVLGPNTVNVLNARTVDWIDRLDANLERWRWLPAAVPDRYIRVNLAAFKLRFLESGQETLQMDIIGGRVARKTPVLAEPLRYLVFSPYWNVPTKIAVEDKLPQLKRDPVAMDGLGFEGLGRGDTAYRPVSSFNWSKVTKANFNVQLRQRPGPMNALGGVKFMLPNRHAVYLHDTPNKELFAKTERDFSSGCIRLSQPAALAQKILAQDNQQPAEEIERLMHRDEPLTVYLKRPIPVWIVYFTAFTDAEGKVQFRRDVYERDAPIIKALRQR